MNHHTTRVLVVEDEAIVAMDIASHLESLGYSVTAICGTGTQAINSIQNTTPDIALMDINLSGELDGIETALKLRADFDIPVIFITAYADDVTVNRAKIVEPLGYLIKPFDITRLESTLEIALYKYTMEKRLRESENRYRLISELVSDFAYAVLVHEDNTLEMEWMTDAYTHLTGYSSNDKDAFSYLQKTVVSEDRKLVRDHIAKTLKGKISTCEYRLVTKTGKIRWIRSYLRPVWDIKEGRVIRLVGASSDITEQVIAERKIRQLSQAVEQSPSTVVITDTTALIEYVNPKFEELTGYRADEVIGQYPNLLKSGEHTPEFYQTLWTEIQAGRVWRGTFHNRRKDGTRYWESAAISALCDEKGTITHYIKVAEDITQNVLASEALQQRTLELQASNAELDAFAHTVAHDIQGELSVIAGFSELLMEMDIANQLDSVQTSLEIINKRAHKMNAITQSLLLLASTRLEEIELTPILMSEIVSEVLQSFSTSIDTCVDEIQVPDTFPDALGYDPWVEQVWANYISNAIKYGGDPLKITLGADELCEDGYIRYWVHDNGDGIRDTDLDRLFIPFSRVVFHEGIQGHGLGLSIVDRIVKRLGGKAGAESTGLPGEGSTFFFTLLKVNPN
jgi:PAS domain S-box-containing protein